MLTEKIIWAAHKKTMHEEITITIPNIRTYCWIPSLKKVTKYIMKKYYHCLRYRVMPFPSPKQEALPKQRTQERHAFQVIEVYCADPIH